MVRIRELIEEDQRHAKLEVRGRAPNGWYLLKLVPTV